MPVSIQMPGPTASPLDRIAQAMNIVSTVYDMSAKSSAIDRAKEDRELAMKKQASADQDAANNVISNEKLAEYGSKYDISDTEGPGSIAFSQKSADGAYKPIYLKPKAEHEKQKSPLLSQGEVANLYKEGGKQVAPGTKGSMLLKYVDGDGSTQQVSMLFPTKRDPNAPASSLSADQRLAKLSGSDKARYDNVRMGLDSVAGMSNALKSGDNTFSVIGDNDFTISRRTFEEALGRMQSGGAINSDEEKRFRAMLPSMTDSAEIQQKKLASLQSEMNSRLATLGFKPEEVGSNESARAVTQKSSDPNAGVVKNANAATGVPSSEDLQAFKWARDNPNDPRSKAILQTLRVKGLK